MKAFPHKRPISNGEWCGMDLRDYFAAKAIVPLIQSHAKNVITSPDDVAELAYLFADALIEKRKLK